MSKRDIIKEIKRDLDGKADYISFKYITVKEIYDLLKEQKHEQILVEWSKDIPYCGNCGERLDISDEVNYCPKCGQEVKW